MFVLGWHFKLYVYPLYCGNFGCSGAALLRDASVEDITDNLLLTFSGTFLIMLGWVAACRAYVQWCVVLFSCIGCTLLFLGAS